MSDWGGLLQGEQRAADAQPTLPADNAEKRAIAYVSKMPEAISGQGGHQATWNAARKLTADFGLDEESTFQILRAHYNPRCLPPWSDFELRHKARDAATKARVRNPVSDRHWDVPSSHYTNSASGDADAPPADDGFDEWEPTDDDAHDAPAQGDQKASPSASVLRRLSDVLPGAIELAERRQRGDEQPIALPWPGYSDALTGGLWPGMHVLVAGTGFGKTQLTMQGGLHAARHGVPVCFVGLELDKPQIALRLLGEQAGVRWSSLYTGHVSLEQIELARSKVDQLSGLPIYIETGTPGGWPASRLAALAGALRRAHPSGPLLIVVDFLQLLSDDPLAERRTDLRERIGSAAYMARHVAREYGVAVWLISSAARDKYSLLAGQLKTAGIGTARAPGCIEPKRVLFNPDALVGLGKESGEIEFAADTVTVLARWPAPLETGERVCIVAVPKVRYAPATWLAMRFAWRFEELPVRSTDDLPEANLSGRGRPKVRADEYERRILELLNRGPVTSQRKIEDAVKGSGENIRKALQRLVDAGAVAKTPGGFFACVSASEKEGEPTQ